MQDTPKFNQIGNFGLTIWPPWLLPNTCSGYLAPVVDRREGNSTLSYCFDIFGIRQFVIRHCHTVPTFLAFDNL
jgi:hypothetical protein